MKTSTLLATKSIHLRSTSCPVTYVTRLHCHHWFLTSSSPSFSTIPFPLLALQIPTLFVWLGLHYNSLTAPLIFIALYYISPQRKPLSPSLVIGKISHLSHRVPSPNLGNNLVLSCQSPVYLLSPTVVSTKDNHTLARQGLIPLRGTLWMWTPRPVYSPT